ncbi:hypothetical protein L7F22_041039 [Adiantum nelumboides]|nr:hypothetical protein [Adiantum nelumboides]
MQMATSGNLYRCTCNYKCRHTDLGYADLGKSTYHAHVQQDLRGNIHPSIQRGQTRNSVRSTTPPQDTQPIHEQTLNASQETRRLWCTCKAYCNGGRTVGSSTYTRHRKMSERYNNLWCSVSGETLNLNGTSLNPVLREVVTPSNPSVEVTSSNPSLGDEITPSDSSLENDTVSREPSCDELNEDFVAEDMLNQETNQNLFSIYDRITEVIIELQTLCDENQASKAFQDRMLRILFGGMGGSRVGRDDTQEEKASLSKLLVQLPSTWDGSLGDVFVPACWDQLNAMFTTLGMVESSRYRVCQGSQDNMYSPILYPPSLEDNYSGNVARCECNAIQKATRKLKRDYKECCEKCTVCGISRKQMMCFDYISIEHQLKCLTRSQSICHEFLEMWRNKKRWLDNSCISEDTKIHEFWDGTKCKNFEDFWNPNSHFELPVICPNSECKQAYRAWPTPDNALQAGSTKYKILCKSCREEFECDKVLCKGDPRNFALLVHWDGFQSSKTTQKNCGVVEVKILNTGKGSEVRALPVIFIPFSCKKIIGSSSKLFHVFLKPLLQELESLFINGIEIQYNYPINSISGLCNSSSSQTFNARAILMMVAGDHPAQCKIGCFKEGGQAFCRRCKAEARQETKGSGRYIYDQNRFQFKYPPNKRNVEESTLAIAKYEKTLFEGERESILKDSGLSGISSLWRLYDLYGFDPHIDLVFDCMHILSLNMFSKYIAGLMKALNNDVKKMVDDATHRMSKWVPSSIRYGRWPRFPRKYHESYKAEENQKFIQWCLPYILCEVKEIPKDFYDLGLLVIEIAHAFYNYTRENGWYLQNINVVRTLLASWRVRTEELLGPNSAPLEHVAGVGEILDDILCHGSHDVIWCYLYERMVSIYVRVKTNHKDEEMTLVNYFRRLLFTWVFAHLQADRDRLLPTTRIYRRVHQSLIAPEGYLVDKERWLQCPPWHELGVLKVTSIEKAKSLWGFFTRGYFTRSLCLNMLIQKGIVVGGKKTSYREARDEERRFCTDYLHKEVTEVEIHNKVFLKGEIYRAGDNVVVLCDEQSRPTQNVGHWKAYIQHFFSLEHNGSIQLFFGAIYYRQMVYSVQEKDYLQIDNTIGMSILQSRVMPYTWDRIRPIESLLHKFIPLQHGNHIISYKTKDLELRQRLIEPGCVGCIPPWIEENDIVQMKSNLNTWCSTSGLQFAVVRAVDQRLRQVKVTWIKEIGNSSSFMDEEGRPPSYDDIFRPPKGSLRDPNKLYGKELLEKQHKRQHAVLLDNYRMVRSWFHNVSLPDDLRHNKKGKDDIMKIICENHDNILELVWLKRAKYKWYVEDIYKWVVNWKQSQIKYKKSKKLLLREEKCSLSKEEGTNDVTKLEASTFPMPIIDEEEEQKKDHMETDKFLMDIKGFEGLQQYKDEDDDNLDHDLEISYTELLQNGLSKRVQATKELSPRDETPMLESYEEMVCPRKCGRKRKLSEKMKKYCEVDNAHIKESNASREVTKRSKEKSNDIEVDVNTLSHEDMETIVLVYSKKKTIMDMYFCLRKMYIGLKKEESSFRSYSKESKSPDSETMIKQVVMWLLHMEKVIVHGCSPISVKDIQIVAHEGVLAAFPTADVGAAERIQHADVLKAAHFTASMAFQAADASNVQETAVSNC